MTETVAPGKERPIPPALDAGIAVCEVSNFRRASSVGISMASTDDGAHHACPKQDSCSGKALSLPVSGFLYSCTFIMNYSVASMRIPAPFPNRLLSIVCVCSACTIAFLYTEGNKFPIIVSVGGSAALPTLAAFLLRETVCFSPTPRYTSERSTRFPMQLVLVTAVNIAGKS